MPRPPPNSIGIAIFSSNDTIGGTVTGDLDLISGNSAYGVEITGAAATGDVVEGDSIGTDITGTVALGSQIGVEITAGAKDNTIGGQSGAAGNLISGNGAYGVLISGVGTQDNVVAGNRIGTDTTGDNPLGNQTGVLVELKASGNTIGGLTSTPGMGAGNDIWGNVNDDVQILDLGTDDNVVEGNSIGENPSGTAPTVSQPAYGVVVSNRAAANTIGGTASGAGNLISQCQQDVTIFLGSYDVVQGNRIGGNVAVTSASQSPVGIAMSGSAAHPSYTTGHNLIGGSTAAQGNIISGVGGDGIFLHEAQLDLVMGNLIGSGPDGSSDLANGGDGIESFDSIGNTIGGTTAGSGNVIAWNLEGGVALGGDQNDLVAGNGIGVGRTGESAAGNSGDGVLVSESTGVTIGGTTAAAGNVISGNFGDGVELNGADTTGNVVEGNLIGLDATGEVALGNAR